MPKTMIKGITIGQLYVESVEQGKPLLCDSDYEFWVKYKANHADYDLAFATLFDSFYFYSRHATLDDFNKAVKAFLTLNYTKYKELFRLEDLPDDAYNILQNYDVTETLDRTTSNDGTEKVGARTDTENTQYGAIDVDNTTAYGAVTTDNTNNYGELSTESHTNNGIRRQTIEEEVSAYDNNAYSPRNKSTINSDADVVDVDSTTGARTDTLTSNTGEHTDTQSTKTAEHTDARTIERGEQNNTNTNNGTENYTLTRKGNIGVQTQSDMLLKHLELWDGYEYYMKIFTDIRDAMLYVDCLVD